MSSQQHAASPGGGAAPAGPRVGVSQDSLFFPLPITGGIENILQLSNQEEVKVAYKIRSTIRYRYAVKPTVGFLHPNEESIVKFLLDPNTMTVDGEAPSEQTKDAFLIDFAFAPPSASSSTSAADEHNNALAFWKQYSSSSGAAPPGGVTRRRMPCVFTTKVPKSLTVHVNAAAAAATLAATTQNNNSGGGGEYLNLKSPSTHFSNGRAASAFEPTTPQTSRSQGQQQQQQSTPVASIPPAIAKVTAAAVVAPKPAATTKVASPITTGASTAGNNSIALAPPSIDTHTGGCRRSGASSSRTVFKDLPALHHSIPTSGAAVAVVATGGVGGGRCPCSVSCAAVRETMTNMGWEQKKHTEQIIFRLHALLPSRGQIISRCVFLWETIVVVSHTLHDDYQGEGGCNLLNT